MNLGHATASVLVGFTQPKTSLIWKLFRQRESALGTNLRWQRSQDGSCPTPGVVVDEVGRSDSGGLNPEVGDRLRLAALPVVSEGREAAVEHGPVRLAAHARRLPGVPELSSMEKRQILISDSDRDQTVIKSHKCSESDKY